MKSEAPNNKNTERISINTCSVLLMLLLVTMTCKSKIVECIDGKTPIMEIGDYSAIRQKLNEKFGLKGEKGVCRPEDGFKVFEIFTENKKGYEKIAMARDMHGTIWGWGDKLAIKIWDETVEDEYKTALKEYVENEQDPMNRLLNFMNLRNNIRFGTKMQETVEEAGLKIFSDVLAEIVKKEDKKAKIEELNSIYNYIYNSFKTQRQIHLIDKFKILEAFTAAENSSYEKIQKAIFILEYTFGRFNTSLFANDRYYPDLEDLELHMTMSEKEQFAFLLSPGKLGSEEHFRVFEEFKKTRKVNYQSFKNKVDSIVTNEYKNAMNECIGKGYKCFDSCWENVKMFYPELRKEIDNFLNDMNKIRKQNEQSRYLEKKNKIQPLCLIDNTRKNIRHKRIYA